MPPSYASNGEGSALVCDIGGPETSVGDGDSGTEGTKLVHGDAEGGRLIKSLV